MLPPPAETWGYSRRRNHGCASPIPPPVAGSLVPAPAAPGSVLINEVLSLPGSTWFPWLYTRGRNIALIAQILEFPLLCQRLRCTR